MPKGLTSSQLAFYHDNGYLPLPQLLDAAQLAPLIDELNQVIDSWAQTYHEQDRLTDLFEDEPFERRLYCIHQAMGGQCPEVMEAVSCKRKTPGMFHVMTQPRLLDVVESVIGPEILVHPQFNSRAKLPDHTSTVSWHQDIAFLTPDVEQTFMVNFWLPLVDADAHNGGLEVIKASHKSSILAYVESTGHLPPDGEPDGKRVCPALSAGGALMMQHKTVHRSGPNMSDGIRWSLDIRYSDPRLPTGQRRGARLHRP